MVAVLAKEIRVDLRARDKHSRTVLSWATVKGYQGVVRLLLNIAQLDPGSRDLEGRMLLAYAAWYGYTATVSLLANLEGMDINSRDHLGQTLLFLAVINRRYNIVHYLYNRADIEQGIINSTEQTLRIAAQDNEDRIILVLLGSFNLHTEEPLPLAARDFLHITGFIITLIALC